MLFGSIFYTHVFVTLLKCLYTVLIFYFQNFLCIFIFIGNDLRHAVQRIQLGWCSCWFCTQNVNMQFCCLKPCVFMLPLHILQHNYCIQFIHLHGTTKSYTPLCCFRWLITLRPFLYILIVWILVCMVNYGIQHCKVHLLVCSQSCWKADLFTVSWFYEKPEKRKKM